MTIRLTNQYLEVLGKENQDGEVRVTRQYASILVASGGGTTHNEAVTQNLSLSSTAIGRVPSQGVDSSLNLSASASGVTFREEQNTASNLSLSGTATASRTRSFSLSSTLNFASLGGKSENAEGSSTLNLSDEQVTQFLFGDRTPAGNELNLTQTVTTLSSINPTSDLGLSQSVEVQAPIKPSIAHVLGLSQHTSTPYHMWVEHDIHLTDQGRVPIVYTFTSTLNLTDVATIYTVEHTLNLSDSVTFGLSYTAFNTLNISHEMEMTGIFMRSVEHTNILGHAMTWFEDGKCLRKQYTPFQGESTLNDDVTPPKDELQDPQGNLNDKFSLYIPPLGVPTSKVTLRKPELDNRDRNAYTRVNNETRGGKVIIYSDPDWPKVRTMIVTIVGLLESDVDNLQTFMLNTLGQEIGITDWEGRLWKGFITNPNEVAVQDGKKQWTVTFEFEGEMLDVEQPDGDDGSEMNLSHTVTAVIV